MELLRHYKRPNSEHDKNHQEIKHAALKYFIICISRNTEKRFCMTIGEEMTILHKIAILPFHSARKFLLSLLASALLWFQHNQTFSYLLKNNTKKFQFAFMVHIIFLVNCI